jgi:hypothetical protein
MTTPNPDAPVPQHDCVSHSPYTDILYDDGPNDPNPPPLPPAVMQRAIAEREKLRQWLAAQNQQSGPADGKHRHEGKESKP